MDRARYEAAEPQAPVPEQEPVRPPVAGGEMAARLLHYQGTGGNQMVLRLLAAARDAGSSAGDGGPAEPPIADRILGRLGGGSPLPAEVRAEAEAGFGRPLGDVRLHTDSTAATLATRLNAHAFTTGNDVFFNSGVYDPGSSRGYNVLVHELTHTMQRPSTPVSGRLAAGGLTVSDVHDPDEREARAVADRLTDLRDAGGSAGPVHGGGGATVRRSSAGGSPLVVHRHSSWEHTMLGNARPSRLGDAVVQPRARQHLLTDLWNQMMFFSEDVARDPRGSFPQVRWIQLATSELWVSYGELNALADYLADPSVADTMKREDLVPVLQKMRSSIREVAGGQIGQPGNGMEGMASHPLEAVSSAAGEVKALDEATAGLGTDRYAGLLARNACHFAPFSWHRWAQFHNEAVEEARAYFATGSRPAPLGNVPVDANQHARQALLKNGYADHFLQDSFAAGHLVNKTLVMQWWVDYLYSVSVRIPGTDLWLGRRGQPDPEVLESMGASRPAGITGRELYRPPGSRGTNRDDRSSGTGVTDPQTAQERTDRARRVSGSGVAGEANYQAYLRLLNNAQAQAASGAVHDYFNREGLMVVNRKGNRMRVGGDDSMLAKSDEVGAQLAGEAARLSRTAIDEVLNSGQTGLTTEAIFDLVPTAVVIEATGEHMPLEKWHDEVLRDRCFGTIFPLFYLNPSSAIIGGLGADMVTGGMSRDAR